MLKTRMWMGSLLIALVICVLVFDRPPWYPFLLLLAIFLAAAGTVELHKLIGAAHGLPLWLSGGSVLLVLLANWPAHRWPDTFGHDSWRLVLAAFTAVLLLGFLVEMAAFRPPLGASPQRQQGMPLLALRAGREEEEGSGSAVIRLSLLMWTTAYLGLLPSFLMQLRWLDATALALVIFVPKCCDIGAYFSGRLLGRHPMAPTLSPKKTWEGLIGGLILSAAAAVAINRTRFMIHGGDAAAVAFGVVVGAAGAVGDLAESMIKRDCRRKDASQVMPGFGGVLDVIDSILFAAPVAYFWLRW